MATMKYLSPSDRMTCISLGADIEKAREIFNKRVNEAIEYAKIWHKGFSMEVMENEIVLKWKEDNEWLMERFYFDAEDNSVYNTRFY